MKKLVTIGGWNGHSHILAGLKNSDFFHTIDLSAIVSMSDDGRTTGLLMQQFEEKYDEHLPPPWDLRRCLYELAECEHARELGKIFESTLSLEWNISDYSLYEMIESLNISQKCLEYLQSKNEYFLNFSLEIEAPIVDHKFWNILMACLYKNFLFDYNYMIRFMHDILHVTAKVIPVTTDRAYIKAFLDTGETIKKQDNISNIVGYDGKIVKLELMNSSLRAKHNFKIDEAILQADYIIISPGDLFTSIISNLIIWKVPQFIKNSRAKIVYIANTTNKWGETTNYSLLDFSLQIEKYLWKQIDYLIVNNKIPKLSDTENQKFASHQSVKWWKYLQLKDSEKKYFKKSWVEVIEADILDVKSLYKHDTKKVARLLQKTIF